MGYFENFRSSYKLIMFLKKHEHSDVDIELFTPASVISGSVEVS